MGGAARRVGAGRSWLPLNSTYNLNVRLLAAHFEGGLDALEPPLGGRGVDCC